MKKLVAVVFAVAFLGSFTLSYATVTPANEVSIAIEKCDKCGKEDCSGCKSEKSEKSEKKECSPDQKKACCAKKHGSKAKSSETKSEEKTESKK